MLLPRVSAARALCLLVLVLGALTTGANAESQLIPLNTARDMVFNHAGSHLYIMTDDGWVLPYRLATGELEQGYQLGGSLNGADISPDDSFLLVAQRDGNGPQGTFHKVNLTTGAVTDIRYNRNFLEGGGWDVAIGANGKALVTTLFIGSGWVPLREIDLATNAIRERSDVPGSEPNSRRVTGGTQLHRSADRSRMYLLESDISSGPVFTYTPATDSFGRSVESGMYFNFASAAVSRDGKLVATLVGIQSELFTSQPAVAVDRAPDFGHVRSFMDTDSGVAFDALQDILYAVRSSTGEIVARDAVSGEEKFRLPFEETVEKGAVQFGPGSLVTSPDGRYLALNTASGVRVFDLAGALPPPPPPPEPTLSTRRDMVFDHAGKFLYVGTSTGLLQRLHLATNTLEIIANLGGQLNGIDIAPDDSFLLVAQHGSGVAGGVVHKLDLQTNIVTNIPYSREQFETGAADVAIGSHGRALFTTNVPDGFSAWTPVREIDLGTNLITIRADMPGSGGAGVYPGLSGGTQIRRSADGSRFYFLEPNSSAGLLFTYSAASDRFGPRSATDTFLDFASAAVSPDGTLLATRHGYPNTATLETAPDFHFLQTFDFDGGVAFDAVVDRLYGVDSRVDQVIAYNTKTHREEFRIDVGENVEQYAAAFGRGQLVASNDGRYLALATEGGIRILNVPSAIPEPVAPPPVFTAPRDMIFDSAGNHLYITASGGTVWRYSLATSELDEVCDLGGIASGLDLAPDDSYLLVAQGKHGSAEGRVQKIEIASGEITNINYKRAAAEAGAWDVAIGSNGLALVTMALPPFFSGSVGVRQIELQTNTISIRKDFPRETVWMGTPMHRSADRTRIALFEYPVSSQAVFTFAAPTNTFGPVQNGFASKHAAVNRDGSLVAAGGNGRAIMARLPNFEHVHTFEGLDASLVFDAVRDVLYGLNTSTREIIGYDTNTRDEKIRIPAGEDISEARAWSGFDIGNFVASPDGRFLALITPSGVRIYDIASGSSRLISTRPYLANISTRAMVRSGDNAAIGGFIITGTQPKKVVLRAVGPSLLSAGISGAIADPTLELRDGSGALLAANDNWQDNQRAEVVQSALAPRNPSEAAIVQTLEPGAYTATMRDKNQTSGVGLIEIYDASPSSTSALANISTRALVETGDNVMIGGVIIGNRNPEWRTPIQKIAVRALGPSLTAAGVPNALRNPVLEVYSSNGILIASNTYWKEFQHAEIEALGLAPADHREAVVVTSVAPGNFTAVVRGLNDGTGVGLVEVYAISQQ